MTIDEEAGNARALTSSRGTMLMLAELWTGGRDPRVINPAGVWVPSHGRACLRPRWPMGRADVERRFYCWLQDVPLRAISQYFLVTDLRYDSAQRRL